MRLKGEKRTVEERFKEQKHDSNKFEIEDIERLHLARNHEVFSQFKYGKLENPETNNLDQTCDDEDENQLHHREVVLERKREELENVENEHLVEAHIMHKTPHRQKGRMGDIYLAALSACKSILGRSEVKILLYWELFRFMKANFEKGQRLGPILVLNGNSRIIQSTTCEKFVQTRWPRLGCKLLEFLETALDVLAKGDSYSNIADIGDLHIDLRWRPCFGKDGKHETFIKAYGLVFQVIELIEALSWLACTFREPTHPGPTYSDVLVEIGGHPGRDDLTCSIEPWPLEPVKADDTSCWHSLFKRPLISNSSLIGYEDLGTGLNISLEDMIHLSGADTPILHEDKLLLMGTSCILVPVKRLQFGAIQWHLITSADEQISVWQVELQGVEALQISSLEELLYAPMHFLGLWKSAKVILGTAEADYRRCGWTTLPEKKKTWSFSGLSLGIGIKGAATANFTLAKAQLTDRLKKPNLVEELLSLKTLPIILYDQEIGEGIAWLVPALSVLLHMAHLYIRKQRLDVTLPHAKASPDSGEAAFEAIKGAADIVIESIGEGKEYQLTFGMLIKRMASNLRRMEPRPMSLGGGVAGYEFADLTLNTDARLKKVPWKIGAERDGWSFFTRKCPLLVCKGLGNVIIPDGVTESDHRVVEKDKGLLVATIGCLKVIAEREGKDLSSGYLSEAAVWYAPHAPFGDCGCDSPPCSPIQYIVRKKRGDQVIPNVVTENMFGAIVIGKQIGRHQSRQVREAASEGLSLNESLSRDISGEELDRDHSCYLEVPGPADLRNMRNDEVLVSINNNRPADQSSISTNETEWSYVTARSMN